METKAPAELGPPSTHWAKAALRPSRVVDLSVSPYDRDYGSGSSSTDGWIDSIDVRIGDRPLVRNLQRLYQLSHKELPPNLAVFDAYSLWLVSHAIGVVAHDNANRVRAIELEVTHTDGIPFYTVDMAPRTQFTTRFGGKLETVVDLGLEGHVSVPDSARKILEETHWLGGDARLHLSTDVSWIGRLSWTSSTPIVQAIGIGSSTCQWFLEKHDAPLVGDHLLFQTVLVPNGVKSVNLELKGKVVIRPKWSMVPAALEITPITATLELL